MPKNPEIDNSEVTAQPENDRPKRRRWTNPRTRESENRSKSASEYRGDQLTRQAYEAGLKVEMLRQ